MQMPRALLFSTGYQANIGAVTALAGPEDAIFSDALNHASLIDGVRLSRARVVRYPHADLGFLSGALAERSEEHTSELQSLTNLVCRLLLEKKKKQKIEHRR